MPRVEAVIFDWGGTLTPWHPIDLVETWRAYADAYDAADAGLAERLAAAERAAWRRQQGSRGAEGTGELEHLFAAEGINTSTDRHLDALRRYLTAWDPHTYADVDAIPLFESLRADGIRIGILSNTMWPRWHHEAVFERDGLLHLIDAAVYSSEIAWAKPHADAFAAALAAVGVPASAAAFVGDRPWDDIHGAQLAGMRAIFVPHSDLGDQAVDIDVEPDATVQQLGDVLHVVRRWND